MVGHHAPGEKVITLTVELAQRVSDDGGARGVREPDRAITPVEFLVHGRRIGGAVAIRLEAIDDRGRQGAMQPEGDVLGHRRRIQMRQVAPAVPSPVFGHRGSADLEVRAPLQF